MTRTVRLIPALALACCVAAQAQVAAPALKRIASTPFFAFGGVGFAGVISEGEKDFRALMTQPKSSALQSFEELYATGNGEAKAYALAGIRALKPTEFDRLADSLHGSREKIATMEGCIVEHRSLTDVAANLRSGRYDYWIKRQPKR